jgi:hypothetical protein
MEDALSDLPSTLRLIERSRDRCFSAMIEQGSYPAGLKMQMKEVLVRPSKRGYEVEVRSEEVVVDDEKDSVKA